VADQRKALNTDIKVYCGDFIIIKNKPFFLQLTYRLSLVTWYEGLWFKRLKLSKVVT